MPDAVSRLLREVVWDKRHAFLVQAVERDIITDAQAGRLVTLWMERDAEMDREDEADA